MSQPSSHRCPLLQDRTKEAAYREGRAPATGSQGGGGFAWETVEWKHLLASLLNEASSEPKLALTPFCDPRVHQGLAHRRCVLGDGFLNEFQIWIFS